MGSEAGESDRESVKGAREGAGMDVDSVATLPAKNPRIAAAITARSIQGFMVALLSYRGLTLWE